MGCHTWFYKKSNRTQQKAKEIVIKNFEDFIDSCKKNNEYWKHRKITERKLRMVQKDMCQVAVWNYQPEISFFCKEKGFFILTDDYHDVFRVYNYPEDKLFSLNETLKFFKDNSLHLNKKTKIKLNEFWEKYPDGMIDFG